jgi:tRNA A-37 threonylcarbamoyl transferase component Bud32
MTTPAGGAPRPAGALYGDGVTERSPAPPVPGHATRAHHRVGEVVGGRYRLVRFVASGGMAQVWEARDQSLHRTVAVKLLHEHLRDDRTVARFRREAVAVASVRHPSIVTVYDTVVEDACDGIVMELVDGETLRDLLDREGPLPVDRAVRIALAVCNALEAAHAAGIVHRDVKPGNVLVAPGDLAKLTDFGIAKVLADIDLTAVGSFVGTAKYVSPEQVQGRTTEPRSDVYATTAMFYEMVCGVPPFEGDSDAAVALARLQRDPLPPSARDSSLSPAIDRVVRAGMARRPEDRIASAAALGAALRGLGDRTTVATIPVAPVPVAKARAPLAPSTDATQAYRTVDDAAPSPTAAMATVAPGAEPVDTNRASGRSRTSLVLLPLVAAVVVGLVVAALLLFENTTARNLVERLTGAGTGADPDSGASPVVVRAARAFDPSGDGREHDDRAALAVDGESATVWTTESYTDRRFGGLKNGVGLVVELSTRSTVDSVRVDTNRRGWSGDIYIADGRPSSLAGYGPPVASLRDASNRARADLGDSVRGTTILIWITDLGEGPSPVSLHVSEVVVDGRAR